MVPPSLCFPQEVNRCEKCDQLVVNLIQLIQFNVLFLFENALPSEVNESVSNADEN